jgi:multidrug efflux system membrane fusion protein
MLRHALSIALPAAVLFLAACGQEAAPPAAPRPALVVQPQPAQPLPTVTPVKCVRASSRSWRSALAARSASAGRGGQRVKADQPLAELDPQDVRLQLEANRAQVAAAEANLALVRAERDRYQKLLERQMVSRSQYDNAENLYRAGLARLKQAKAEFDVAGNQAEYAVLRAPQAGVIAKRQVEVGQVVAAGQTVFTLAADGEREVLISLPEQQFARFAVGQPVSVELWSHPQERFQGASASCRRPPTRARAPSPRASPSPRRQGRPNWARAPGCSCP